MNRLLISAALLLIAVTGAAQGWVYSPEHNTDFWTDQDKGLDYVDCSTGIKYDAWNAYVCTKRNGIESVRHNASAVNTSGLYGKIAAGVAAQRPRRSSAKSGAYTGNYNHQTSDAHREWAARRQADIQAARERAAEKKRLEKIEDDRRAAAAEAAANARLQIETDRRVARDHWNAGRGAQLAAQRARDAYQPRGPQQARKSPEMSAGYKAGLLRRQNKPRRDMRVNPQARNTARRVLPAVRRTTAMSAEQTAMLRKALAVKKEIQRRKALAVALPAKPATASLVDVKDARFRLSDGATSTLGRDWHSDDFKPLPPPPPPVTRVKRKMTAGEYHNLIVIEMIDQRPLTPAEKKYYENLTI